MAFYPQALLIVIVHYGIQTLIKVIEYHCFVHTRVVQEIQDTELTNHCKLILIDLTLCQ